MINLSKSELPIELTTSDNISTFDMPNDGQSYRLI